MKYTDLTFPTPEHNLACDEALLELCENGYEHEILRFWEPIQFFVVLGYSGKVLSEVNLLSCEKSKIPIFRRPSGGGTVLQGPGCLNFSLILKIENSRELRNIAGTNSYIMEGHKKALQPLMEHVIEVEGFSDLTAKTLKFSGNAQRRKRRFLLFHGTFLLNFDISMIEKFLLIPIRQPCYRKNRSHTDFLTNLNLPANGIKDALRKFWDADGTLERLPVEDIEQLVKARYATRDWNFKF